MTGNDFSSDGFYNSDFGDNYHSYTPNDYTGTYEQAEVDGQAGEFQGQSGKPSYPRIRASNSTAAPQNRIRPNTVKQKAGMTTNSGVSSNSNIQGGKVARSSSAATGTLNQNNFMEISDENGNGLQSSHTMYSNNIIGTTNNNNNKDRTRTSSSMKEQGRYISSPSANTDEFLSNVSNVAYGLGMSVATAVATGHPAHLPTELLSQTYQQYTSSFLSYNYYRYYFKVDNTYVLHKITKLIFPFLKLKPQDWHRKMAQSSLSSETSAPPLHDVNTHDDGDVITSLSPEQASKLRRDRSLHGQSKWLNNSPFEPPVNDVNAPDMYIPLMAIITYIVIMGFAVGTQQRAKFTPQVLVATASSAFGMLIFEVLIMKSGFWFIGNVAIPPFWLDLICYAGYKLIFVVMNLGIFTLFPSLTVYYIVSIGTGCLAGLFMIQTLRPYFRTDQLGQDTFFQGIHSAEHSSAKTKQIFLGLVGLAQVIFIQLMGRYIS